MGSTAPLSPPCGCSCCVCSYASKFLIHSGFNLIKHKFLRKATLSKLATEPSLNKGTLALIQYLKEQRLGREVRAYRITVVMHLLHIHFRYQISFKLFTCHKITNFQLTLENMHHQPNTYQLHAWVLGPALFIPSSMSPSLGGGWV